LWEDGLVDYATWEDNYVLDQAYPHFYLEDKVDFDGGRIVRKKMLKLEKLTCV